MKSPSKVHSNDIAKNNSREERAIATNNTEINKDMRDTQNNIVVDHIKWIQAKLMVTNFTIICQKTQDEETIASLILAPKMQVIMEILMGNKKTCVHRRRQYDKKIDDCLLTSFVNYIYIVKVGPFVTTKTDDTYDHMKPTQRNFQPNVYISDVGTNDLPTNMTPEEISEKILLFLNI